jgi:glucose-1-phosphate thymidylyltransferase
MGYIMRKLGIILAGGKSTRMYPSTLVVSKQLLPVYDKPLIYYPLSSLMLAGVRDFVIITSFSEKAKVDELFDKSEEYLGINVTTLVQPSPVGIADAFRIVKESLGDKLSQYDMTALILGDNIFYGTGFTGMVSKVSNESATVFAYTSQNPSAFGVVEIKDKKVISLEEKPIKPKSNLIVTGLYFYPNDVYDKVYQLKPSARGELEITDLNKLYLEENKLDVVKLYRGMVWFDTGTSESMLEAANFIHNIQKHQGYMVGNPHEIAIKNKWTTGIQPFIDMCSKTKYGIYLQNMVSNL